MRGGLSSTLLIYSIKHEHLCKILYVDILYGLGCGIPVGGGWIPIGGVGDTFLQNLEGEFNRKPSPKIIMCMPYIGY